MTSDQEHLNKIFEAALKEPDPEPVAQPKVATPHQRSQSAAASPGSSTQARTGPQASTPKPEVQTATDSGGQEDDGEVGQVLEEKMKKEAGKRKRQRLVSLLVIFGVIGGGTGWFFSSAERRDGLFNAAKEIKAATDAKKIAEGYNDSLDKVAVRGSQLDQATSAMGVSSDIPEGEDGHMDKEMKGLMGGEGRTTGDRAKAMEKSFGDRAKKAGGVHKPKADITEDNTFSFD